jgi:myo-inositol-1(or 4)-monophosphatase
VGGSPPTPLVSDELLELALDAAHAAGALLVDAAARPAEGVRTKSTETDLVSEADLAAERAIRELLAEHRPGDTLLGEEGGESPLGDGEPTGIRWVVDPLDGTINFLFGIPQWCVSVAAEDERGALVGVVFDAPRGETFAATRDGAATLDGKPFEGPGREPLARAMIATGFAYDAALRERQAEVVVGLLGNVRDVRRFGAAAIDLCWTACGRVDAYYERGLNHWDMAAGALICERAGVALRALEAVDGLPGGVVAGPPGIVDELHALVGP